MKKISIHAPRKGERPKLLPIYTTLIYFNPRSPQGGATMVWRRIDPRTISISIHAPRQGERRFARRCILQHRHISIHAPRKGERLHGCRCRNPRRRFQSTLPARGSDQARANIGAEKADFNPRSPQGGATYIVAQEVTGGGFQSTLPARGSDYYVTCRDKKQEISIHAPRKGERQCKR